MYEYLQNHKPCNTNQRLAFTWPIYIIQSGWVYLVWSFMDLKVDFATFIIGRDAQGTGRTLRDARWSWTMLAITAEQKTSYQNFTGKRNLYFSIWKNTRS